MLDRCSADYSLWRFFSPLSAGPLRIIKSTLRSLQKKKNTPLQVLHSQEKYTFKGACRQVFIDIWVVKLQNYRFFMIQFGFRSTKFVLFMFFPRVLSCFVLRTRRLHGHAVHPRHVWTAPTVEASFSEVQHFLHLGKILFSLKITAYSRCLYLQGWEPELSECLFFKLFSKVFPIREPNKSTFKDKQLKRRVRSCWNCRWWFLISHRVKTIFHLLVI